MAIYYKMFLIQKLFIKIFKKHFIAPLPSPLRGEARKGT